MSFDRVTLVALASLLTVGMTSIAKSQQADTRLAIGGWSGVWGTSTYGSWCTGYYTPDAVYAPAADYPTPVRHCYYGYPYYRLSQPAR
jgi:hypothetical protein